MIDLEKALRTRTVVAACAVVATIGVTAFASAAGDGSGTTSTGSAPAAAAQPSRAAEPGAAERLLELRRTHGVEVDVNAMRTVAAPGARGDAASWALAPTRDGGLCAATPRAVFCGSDRAAVEAGRAAATEYPPDKILGEDPSTGYLMVKPSDGTGVRSGIAPAQAVEVVVLDREGRVLRRTAVAQGLYEVAVPAQGSDARVAFVDAAGDTIASRPAEG